MSMSHERDTALDTTEETTVEMDATAEAPEIGEDTIVEGVDLEASDADTTLDEVTDELLTTEEGQLDVLADERARLAPHGIKLGRNPVAAVRALGDAVIALRASKGMVLSPSDPDSVSAGSFFTNPIVSERFAHGLPTDAPRWLLDPDAPESDVKLSAAWLIERSGISRGFSLPGSKAGISSKHTLAIINRGGATADDIVQLARFIHVRVLNQFGVNLYPEPQFIGLTL